jgi:RIO kinase 1
MQHDQMFDDHDDVDEPDEGGPTRHPPGGGRSQSFDHFLSEGLITSVIRPLKSGKEASVHLCRGDRALTGHDLLALKVYHPRERRDFHNHRVYGDGYVILDDRVRRAVRNKSRFGRQAEGEIWLGREWETLTALHRAGCDVPEPVAQGSGAILMEYIGDPEEPAPQVRHVRFDRREGTRVLARVLWNVELALRHNVIHADLSPFNVLYHRGRVVVIDLPQAVDARFNRSAYDLLARDVTTLCRYFDRFGVRSDPDAMVADLWTRFIFAAL